MKQFLFVRDTIIEAETEEKAEEEFADTSSSFAIDAKVYEVCDKCFPHVEVHTCRCNKDSDLKQLNADLLDELKSCVDYIENGTEIDIEELKTFIAKAKGE